MAIDLSDGSHVVATFGANPSTNITFSSGNWWDSLGFTLGSYKW